MNFGQETEEAKSYSWLQPVGEGAGAFFTALGYGKAPVAGTTGFNWMPVILLGGAAVGGFILITTMGRKRRRR